MKSVGQFIYSLILIILIPLAIAGNTWYLLKNFRRDTDFELNNKALLLTQSLAIHSRTQLSDPAILQKNIDELTTTLPEISAISIFDSSFQLLASTSSPSSILTDTTLNQLALNTGKSYSKQIIASFTLGSSQRVWQVATPIDKSGVINLYLSAHEIDAITTRTAHDSLWLLAATILITILLLVNHLHFFETSILYKKLSEIDKLKDDFISVASHELKTPMTTLIGYSQLLLKNPSITNNPDIASYLSAIAISVDRLKNLVTDMLDVSRIEQNRATINLRPTNIHEIISRVITDTGEQATTKKLNLNYVPGPQPIMVRLDPNKFYQIVLNLVSNAIKYTPTGSIDVSYDIHGSSVSIHVKDTGVGISPNDRNKLFTKFSRIYNEKTAEISGTGLGLWITKQLVEKMNGKIFVDSIEHHGSQFTITFPINSTAK